MIYDLPTTVTLDGTEYPIRSDYRAILDICLALTDVELTQQEKAFVLLNIFYEDYKQIPEHLLKDAVIECFKFINLGEDTEQKTTHGKLMDWEQDFKYIIAPINRVIGQEIRNIPYLHWWSFIAAYYEIGDCTFAQIVRIRELKAKGKKLDDIDASWYKEHRDLVDIKAKYSDAEKDLLKSWGAL